MFNTDSFGNIYFPAGVSVGNYPTITTTPTHVLVAGAGGRISRVAISQLTSSSPVTSVFGRTGAVVAIPGDYDTDTIKENTNLYFTVNRARASISLTALGTTGPATYNPVTGIINVPQYQNEFSGVNTFNTRVGDVVLTALDVTTALTYTPIGVETDPVWGAQKVFYYTKVESDALFALVGHTHTTTEIAEGTNLYFTTARARAALSAGTGISYNNTTGVITNSAPDQTVVLTQGAGISITGTYPSFTIASTITQYTDALARASISGGTGISYNSVSGVITNTITQYTNALSRLSISLTTNGTTGVSTYNSSTGVFNIPNYTTDLTGYATESYVNTQVSGLVDAAPTTLNTLNELAAALGDDPNFATTVTNLIGTKEPIITPGTTAQYWRGDKSWQTLPIYTLSGLGGQPQLNGTGFVKASGTTISYDNSTYYLASNPSGYITGNQNITLSGDVTGSGTTSIATTIVNNAVTTAKINNGAVTAAKLATFGAGEGIYWAANTDGASIIFESTGDGAGGGRALSNLLIALVDNGDEGLKVTTTGSELLYVNINQFQYKGSNVWTAASLTNLNQLANGPGYITSASIGNGTLTLNVSGNGLSGSTSFTANQSGGSTFTVTSNATTSATANTLVYRDSGADIYARYFFGSYVNTSDNDEAGITRFIIKNGDNYHRSATTTVAANIIRGVASGTWSINISGNAETVDGFSASQSTVGNNIVVRDPNGYIFGNYINMSDDGNPGGGTSISSFITKQGDNYYRSVSPTNAMVSIRGVASGTWQIGITGNAGSITNQANSATITASTGVNANHIVQRDGNGYIYANHINFNTSESENPPINSFFTSNGDGWSRKSSLQHVRNQLGNYGGWITGYTETDTLASVTSRGSVTSTTITASNFITSSDRRVKSEITNIENPFEILNKINSYEYIKDGNKEAGFIAQEVQEAIPYAVFEGDNGMLTMSDRPVLAYLFAAVMELKEENTILKEKLGL